MQETRSRQGGAGRHPHMSSTAWPPTPSRPYSLFPPEHRRANSVSPQPSPAFVRPVPVPSPPTMTTTTTTPHNAPRRAGGGGITTEAATRAPRREPELEEWPTFVQYNTTPPLDPPTESPRKSDSKKGKRSKRRKGSLRSVVDDEERRSRFARVSMRALHVLSHMALCVVVLYIMFMFLAMPAVTTTRNQRINSILNERNNLNRKEAFGLVTILSVDVILDLYGLWVCRSHWSRPALAARLVVGGGYIAIFIVYYALGGRVFPSQFTFFRMKGSFAAPFLYLFMWTLGTWNVLWVVMYRHQLLGKKRRGDGSAEETTLGGSSSGGGFRSQDDAVTQQQQDHARKDSVGSSAASTWRRPVWPFLRKGSLDDDDDDATTIRVMEEQQEADHDYAIKVSTYEELKDSTLAGDSIPVYYGSWAFHMVLDLPEPDGRKIPHVRTASMEHMQGPALMLGMDPTPLPNETPARRHPRGRDERGTHKPRRLPQRREPTKHSATATTNNTTVSDSQQNGSSSNDSTTLVLIAIIVGLVALIAISVFVILRMLRLRERRRTQQQQQRQYGQDGKHLVYDETGHLSPYLHAAPSQQRKLSKLSDADRRSWSEHVQQEQRAMMIRKSLASRSAEFHGGRRHHSDSVSSSGSGSGSSFIEPSLAASRPATSSEPMSAAAHSNSGVGVEQEKDGEEEQCFRKGGLRNDWKAFEAQMHLDKSLSRETHPAAAGRGL
ncbi:hypothetical protein PpBr36_07849 [Pyricularia pennisetigena]|uniref:hypothetical protein n=1 Tax=Pyricularia pennisetigena TaxID=1578925 RepID=UPI00115031DD|nr:hypothetical protein PpBr36_07849 [Pyricularia pennisetigena]TLS26096.1 hypothetical protein PpBr36_07849 [Pyricularia pennisetigena]